MFQAHLPALAGVALCPVLLTLGAGFLSSAPAPQGSARPVCDAGPAQMVQCTGPVMQIQLDGSASTASSGGPLSYKWAGCGDDIFTLSDPSSPTPILTVDMSGSCTVKCQLTLEVSNSSGTSICSTFVTVGDTLPPSISCPTDVTLDLGDDTSPASTGMATATDACNPSPAVAWSDDLSGISPDGYGYLLRTWTASDGCHRSSCVQTIKIAREVHFSLFPEYCPNEIVLGGGSGLLDGNRVPASILGNAIDVTQVSLSTITFSPVGGFDLGSIQPVTIAFADQGQPDLGLEYCECSLTVPDGKTDLFLEFDTQELITVFGLQGLPSGTLFPVEISGDLLTQEPFRGDDCLLIRVP